MTDIRQINIALCEALGIDAEKVSKVTLNIGANEVPTVEVTHLMLDAPVDLIHELRRYELKLIDPSPEQLEEP